MRTLQTLIDEAIEMCGGQTALAKRLGVERQDVHKLASGKRPLSPALVAMLGDVLRLEGTEVQRLAAEAVIAAAAPEKQGVLRRAFFALSPTGGVFGAVALTLIGAFGTTAPRVASAVTETTTMYRRSTRRGLQLGY